MTDWAEIHRTEVAPALARWQAPMPMAVRGIVVVAVVAGVAAVVLIPPPFGLVGLAPLLMVGFGAWARRTNANAAATGETLLWSGRVADLRIEKVLTDDTRTAATEARKVHVAQVVLDHRGTLDAGGARWTATEGEQRLTVDPAVYEALTVGDALVAVSLPTAPTHVFHRAAERQ
ncbi:MAG: hypothetical protein H6738_09060 [Alphaproteobacteria bacterium]|nr:hypothetical protein [Alphaproteobacteria bacterium]MCB9696911.1 hypothetical protein [Alphaproteobacteria bacterium]